jgi:hypothetical protein
MIMRWISEVPDGPHHADGGKSSAVVPGARALYGGCQSHFPNSPRLCLSMLSLTASTSSSTAAAKPTTLTIATSFTIGDLDPIENGYGATNLATANC